MIERGEGLSPFMGAGGVLRTWVNNSTESADVKDRLHAAIDALVAIEDTARVYIAAKDTVDEGGSCVPNGRGACVRCHAREGNYAYCEVGDAMEVLAEAEATLRRLVEGAP